MCLCPIGDVLPSAHLLPLWIAEAGALSIYPFFSTYCESARRSSSILHGTFSVSPPSAHGRVCTVGFPGSPALNGADRPCMATLVTEINLSGLGMISTLGYQLSSLTSVTNFDMSKNNLHGDIPYQLPPNAVHINLAGNAFTGGVPYSISQMTDIEYLNVASNQLNGQLTD